MDLVTLFPGGLGAVVAFLFYRLERAKDTALAKQTEQTAYEREQKHILIKDLKECKEKTLRIISVAKHPRIPKGVSDELDRIILE